MILDCSKGDVAFAMLASDLDRVSIHICILRLHVYDACMRGP